MNDALDRGFSRLRVYCRSNPTDGRELREVGNPTSSPPILTPVILLSSVLLGHDTGSTKWRLEERGEQGKRHEGLLTGRCIGAKVGAPAYAERYSS